ncbi:MAG: lipid A biosynthesis acyltransferase [Chloroflexi bacterium]|nr:lipid A biosynthesis acyltransferase [Chloroflexota bacterium]
MTVMPAPAPAVADKRDSVPSASIESPGGRLPRRPSTRYRRERPRQRRYRLAKAIASVVSRIVSWLPDPLRDGVADRAGDLWIRLTPVYRANVIANIGQVLGPETSRPELETMAKTIFRMSARNFGELLRLPHLTRSELLALMPIPAQDIDVLRDAHERGQGVVIATAHMGAFDLLGHAIAALGVPMTVITGRTTSRFVFDGVTHLRHSHSMTMVDPSPGGVRRVIHALRRGEIAGFVVDYDFFQNGLPMTFFGRETTLPPGAIRIARDTGALVIPMFPRRGPGGHELSVGEPFQVPRTPDIDADVAAGMEILKSRLEEGIGANPDQWVLFQRAWPLAPAPPVRVFPVGSPLESELLKNVDTVLPPDRDDVEGVRS